MFPVITETFAKRILKANEDAIESGLRVLAHYETSKGGIYIITEADRSCTTILFCDEY